MWNFVHAERLSFKRSVLLAAAQSGGSISAASHSSAWSSSTNHRPTYRPLRGWAPRRTAEGERSAGPPEDAASDCLRIDVTETKAEILDHRHRKGQLVFALADGVTCRVPSG